MTQGLRSSNSFFCLFSVVFAHCCVPGAHWALVVWMTKRKKGAGCHEASLYGGASGWNVLEAAAWSLGSCRPLPHRRDIG